MSLTVTRPLAYGIYPNREKSVESSETEELSASTVEKVSGMLSRFAPAFAAETAPDISAAIKSGDHAVFMDTLLHIPLREAVINKSQILEYIVKNRSELRKFVNERKLLDNDVVQCEFKPLSEGKDSFYDFTFEMTLDGDESDLEANQIKENIPPITLNSHYFSESVTVYELKNKEQRLVGHVIVAKNKVKVDTLQEYKKILRGRGSHSYEVVWISTEIMQRKKGLGYLLLYSVLADKLRSPGTQVTLTDGSCFTAEKLYQNIHLYTNDAGQEVKEFQMRTACSEYLYYPL